VTERDISEFAKGLSKTNKAFEDQWLAKFSKGVENTVGSAVRLKVMKGSDRLAASANQQEVIDWTIEAMDRLDDLVDAKSRRDIMTGCACHFPDQRLLPLRAEYQRTKDIDKVHMMLRQLFVSDLKNVLKLDDELVNKILSWGWGVAGVRRSNTIIATKVPFELKEHLASTDPREKRYHYCHCPRIREAIKSPETRISKTYCYCGAGFYKHIWETILQQPVEVEVLESVLEGNDLCKIAIHLPSGVG